MQEGLAVFLQGVPGPPVAIDIYAIYAIYAFAMPYLARTGVRSEPSLGYARGYSGPSRSKV